jgi:hypothetical protein
MGYKRKGKYHALYEGNKYIFQPLVISGYVEKIFYVGCIAVQKENLFTGKLADGFFDEVLNELKLQQAELSMREDILSIYVLKDRYEDWFMLVTVDYANFRLSPDLIRLQQIKSHVNEQDDLFIPIYPHPVS